MNKDLLIQVKHKILENPDHFSMSEWFSDFNGQEHFRYPDMQEASCGTTACIAGWALSLAKPGGKIYESLQHDAAEVLDISYSRSDDLFYQSYWPTAFRAQYLEARNNKERAEAAARRIDHFIATEGI